MSLFGPPNIEKLKMKRDVPGLIKALSYHKDPGICRAAAMALGQLRAPEAIKPLVAALKEYDNTTRESVVWALGTIGTPEALNHVVPLLNDPAGNVRKTAVNALGKAAIPEHGAILLKTFDRQDQEIYQETLHALIQIGKTMDEHTRNEQIIQPLSTYCLRETNKAFRLSILDAWEKMGWKPDKSATGAIYWIEKGQWERCVEIGAPAAEPLVAALSHEDKNVRQMAFQTLVQIGPPVAQPVIAALRHEHVEVRQAAFWALIKIGAPIVDLLIQGLEDEHEEIRQAIATVLGHIGDVRAVVPLIGVFRDGDWGVRRDAYKSVVKIGKPAIPQLIAALKHPSGEIRWGAAGTLEALGWKPGKDEIAANYWIVKGEWRKCVEIGPPAIPPLVESLSHWDKDVVKDAVGTLVHIGRPCVPSLIAVLKDSNPQVRTQAATALGFIGDERALNSLRELLSEKDKAVSKAASDAISAIETGEVWRGTT